MEFPLYAIVGDRPVKAERTEDGGMVLLAFDWHPAVGVICLMVFTITATAIFHRFWTKSDPIQRNISRITLLGNLAILGGLLLLLENVR